MTNEEKIKAWREYDSSNMDMYELIVADEREKMAQLPNDTGFMTWFEKYFKPLKEPKLWTSKARGQAYGVNDLIAMYNKAMQENLKEITTDEREKMQGVEVWVSWDEDKHTMLSLSVPVLSIDKPEYNNHSIVGKNYRYNDNDDYSAGLTREIAKHLNIQQGQCKKFRIVEVGNE